MITVFPGDVQDECLDNQPPGEISQLGSQGEGRSGASVENASERPA